VNTATVAVRMGAPASVLKRYRLRALLAKYGIAHAWEGSFISFPTVEDFEKFKTALRREGVSL